MPHRSATACFPDQPVVDDHFLQDVVLVDHVEAGYFVRQAPRFLREGLVDRDHAAVPVGPRNPGEVPGVAGVAGHEIDQRESEILRNALVLLILVGEILQRPVDIGLWVVGEGKP